jgi:hypothetical protein
MKWHLAANKLHSHAVCGRTYRGQRSTLRMLGLSTWEQTTPDQRCRQCDEKAATALALPCHHEWDGPPQGDTAVTCLNCGLRQA